MKESIVLLNNHVREIFEKSTTWYIILFMTQIFIIALIIYVYIEIEDNNYHLYMNTKTSLESIHNVKIDKYDGSIEKQLSTEEKLIRQHTKRWHLKYLFK